jgi:hypothetical protein
LGSGLGDGRGLGYGLGLGDGLGEGDGLGDGLGEGEGLGDGLGLGDGTGLGEGDGLWATRKLGRRTAAKIMATNTFMKIRCGSWIFQRPTSYSASWRFWQRLPAR